MPPPTRITFVRHGEVHNPRRVLYGRLPRFQLSRRGREQAAALAAALAPVCVEGELEAPASAVTYAVAGGPGSAPACSPT